MSWGTACPADTAGGTRNGSACQSGRWFAEQEVDAGPADAKTFDSCACPEFVLLAQPPHCHRVDLWFASRVDAARLGRNDALELALAPHVGLECGETRRACRGTPLPAAVLVSTGCSVARS